MAEYHVGCGLADIYAGTLNKAKTRWLSKSVVTKEAVSAAAEYLYFNRKMLHFEIDGKKYILKVEEDHT